MVDARRPERPRGGPGIGRPSRQVDVGRVIRPDRGSDRRIVEEALAERQRVVGAGGHQHDVHEARARDQPHLVAVFLERLEADLAGMHLGRLAGCAQAQRHVGVLGVGDDELAAIRVSVDRGELTVERLLHGLTASPALAQRS
jgi:hypothetical protein